MSCDNCTDEPVTASGMVVMMVAVKVEVIAMATVMAAVKDVPIVCVVKANV